METEEFYKNEHRRKQNLIFKYKDKVLKTSEKTILCGIINVTPDSFSDGGKYYDTKLAVERAKKLIDDGAAMLDIGGESTRPGSTYVDIQDEINRVVPVIKEVKKFTDIPISVDTWKSKVAKAAIDAGADIINDITGFLGDSDMANVVGQSDAGVILMFNAVIARPNHESSKVFPKFGFSEPFTKEETKSFSNMDIMKIIEAYYMKSLKKAFENNIEKERIMLDPGIGFGLTDLENLSILDKINIIKEMGYFTFLGVSRKRFISNILKQNNINTDSDSEEAMHDKDYASAVISALSSYKNVEVLRVHSIKKHLIATSLANAIKFTNDIYN